MQEKWNDHHELEGTHSFFSASQHAWLNYDDEKLMARYLNKDAQTIGTIIHSLAEKCIRNHITLSENDLNMVELELRQNHINPKSYNSEKILTNLIPFVNDALGFKMSPEVILYADKDAYGTTDAILADSRAKVLRIHDLKTGEKECDFKQHFIYSAYYCIEYKKDPNYFKTIEFRIYQNCQVLTYNPKPEEIVYVMNIILHHIDLIKNVR